MSEQQARARSAVTKAFKFLIGALISGGLGLWLSLASNEVALSDYFLIPLGLCLGLWALYQFFLAYVRYLRLWKRQRIFSIYIPLFSIVLLGLVAQTLWLLGLL